VTNKPVIIVIASRIFTSQDRKLYYQIQIGASPVADEMNATRKVRDFESSQTRYRTKRRKIVLFFDRPFDFRYIQCVDISYCQ